MPNRILKESICESRDLSSCSFFAQDLYKRLITYADDYGRFNADPEIMIARLYPRELNAVSVDDVMDAIIELNGVGKVGFYTSSPRRDVYGAFPHWSDHQRVRDSKKKNPDPTDTAVNDWYYRRFIPIDMKVAIIERDNFTCKICGKKITNITDAKRLVKMGTGLFHIDHIVPCNQGGRATMENLRLTCPKCNQSRKKTFCFDEIVQFAECGGNDAQVAASCGELPPNPIQKESNPNPNTNTRTHADEAFDLFYSRYPRHVDKADAKKAWSKLKEADYDSVLAGLEKWIPYFDSEEEQYIPHPATWLNKRRWESEPPKVKKQNAALKYEQKPISKEDFDALVVDLGEVPV